MKLSELDAKYRFRGGLNYITTEFINSQCGFLEEVECIFINSGTLVKFINNDMRQRENLRQDILACILNDRWDKKEKVFYLHNGGVDFNYFYTPTRKIKIYKYKEVQDDYMLFADKNRKIIRSIAFV